MNNKDILYIILFVLGFAYIYRNNCSIKNIKIEHMTDMNNEALSMLASIYNKKKLVVDELEVTGKAHIKGDIVTGHAHIKGDMNVDGHTFVNGNGYFGPAYIGRVNKNDSNFAMFAHKNNTSWRDYGFLQEQNGNTFINGGGQGAHIHFRTNNTDEAIYKGAMTLPKITVNELNVKNPKGNWTHFNYHNKGINMIRGPMMN